MTSPQSRLALTSTTHLPRALAPSGWVALEYVESGVAAQYVEKAAAYDAEFRVFLRRLIEARSSDRQQVSLAARLWHAHVAGDRDPLTFEVVPRRASGKTTTRLGWLSPVQAWAILFCTSKVASFELLADPERIGGVELGGRAVAPPTTARWRVRLPLRHSPIRLEVWDDSLESFCVELALRSQRQ